MSSTLDKYKKELERCVHCGGRDKESCDNPAYFCTPCVQGRGNRLGIDLPIPYKDLGLKE
jgi:hypothetical protein